MIDIDVIGQLLPNPITMLTQLCSTLVLFLIIKKFLWKSITNMLDRRAEKMQEELTASEQAHQQALQDREDARLQLKEAVTRSQTIIEKATVEAKSVREEIVRKAKTEADDQIVRARGQIELERSQMQSEIHKEMVEVAMSAAEKLIGEKKQRSQRSPGCRSICKGSNSVWPVRSLNGTARHSLNWLKKPETSFTGVSRPVI